MQKSLGTVNIRQKSLIYGNEIVDGSGGDIGWSCVGKCNFHRSRCQHPCIGNDQAID
jgi:hypothetical protein